MTAPEVLDLVAGESGLTVADLRGVDRHQPRPLARAVAVWLLVRQIGKTAAEAGVLVGRTESTARYYLAMVRRRCRHDPAFLTMVLELEREVVR